jgi:hypothetical protein
MNKNYKQKISILFVVTLIGVVVYTGLEFRKVNSEIENINGRLDKLVLVISDSKPTSSGYNIPYWLSVGAKDLRVKEGSALDFSNIVVNPSIQYPATIVNNHFEVNDQVQRFHCGTMPLNPQSGGIPKQYESEELALQLNRHGYNLVRINELDIALMQLGHDAPVDGYIPTQINEFHYNTQALDDLFFFINELKKQDIRVMMDVATSKNAMYFIGNNRAVDAGYNFRLDVHFDADAQAHWKGMVELIFNSVNPYTGLALIKDPVLTALTMVNESGIAFNSSDTYPPKLIEAFNKYQDDRGGEVASGDMLRWKDRSNISQDLQEFMTLKETKTLQWMTDYLRDLGYSGAITNYNNGKIIQSMGVRDKTDFTAVHAYYDHPSNFVRNGSEIDNSSSLQERLPYVRYFATVRRSGKPFIVDEYNHVYWSKWRREQGISVPSYASLQDWDGLCTFSRPVALDYNSSDFLGQPKGSRELAMYPFKVGTDPIARANETLSFFLFRRGDVSSSNSHLGISIDEQTYSGPLSVGGRIPDSLSLASLVTKVSSFTSGNKRGVTNHDIRLEDAFDLEWWQINKDLVAKGGVDSSLNNSWTRLISSTKELQLDVNERTMKVITPRTEAVVFPESNHESIGSSPFINLDKLKIWSASSGALVSISSLDNKGIGQSERMLIIVSTDAKNTGDEFSDGRKIMTKHGKFPVLLQNIVVDLEVVNDHAEDMELYALYLNGDRNQRVNLNFNQSNNSVQAVIDLSKLGDNPTTFFELIKKKEVY